MLPKYFKAIAVLLAVLIPLSLVGCKQTQRPNGADSTAQATVAPSETVASTEAPTESTTGATAAVTEPSTAPETEPPSADTTVPSETTAPTEAPTENTTEATAAVTEPSTAPETKPPVTTEATKPETAPTQPSTETTPLTTTPPVTTAPTKATTPPETTAPSSSKGNEAEVLPNSEAAIPNITTVVASGVLVKSNESASIDYSNTKDGYVMVCYLADTENRLKVRVKGPKTTYSYNLTPKQWAAFPLSDENGDYQITVYRNVKDSSYAAVLSVQVSVTMEDEFAPFIRPNQYVSFDQAPNTVAKAAALTKGVSDPLKKVEAIYDYVVTNLTYDTELAANVTSGYLPNLDAVLSKKSGICFDYAALMTGMLRSQGVPTKLVIGYVGDVYHAWINVWSESTGWVDGVIYFDGTNWQRMDPTFASSGGSNIINYIGDGTNYSAKYFY